MTRARLSQVAAALAGGIALIAPTASHASQESSASRLLITVADPSGAVIPNAEVRVARQLEGVEPAPPTGDPLHTSEAGIVTVENLTAGFYAVVASFPGFETIMVRDLPVRGGDTRRTITLPIRTVAEDLVVDRDGQSAGLDPRGNAFSTVLTREQIEALPDDPDELEAALKAMSPPGAVLRVDGFSGGRMPPKQQIRSIRLPRMDQLAAQNHGGMTGMMHIEVMTRPGGGPIAGSFDVTLRDDALNARNPFAPVKGDEALRQGGFTLSGGIVPDRSSFSMTVQRASLFNTGNLLAAVPGRTVADAVRQPGESINVHARFDQALSAERALRVMYSQSDRENRNLGVGGFDLADRAFSDESSQRTLRVSENGPIGRRFFSESRLQLRWMSASASSDIEAATSRVLDAFTSGGAQRQGGRRSFDIEAATDLDYVRGRHSLRAGLLVEGGRYRSDEFSNYLGTFTFANLADFEAGRPLNYSRRVGDPDVRFSNLQVGAYLQDDYRMFKSLLVSYGVRCEAQTLISDANGFSPRVSLTWSPLASGRTTVRGGFGLFSDWLGTGAYEQTLRLNGERQQEINVANPAFPDPDAAGAALPGNRYGLGDGLVLPESMTANVGIDQQLTESFRVSSTYTYRRGSKLLRGRNLNIPVDGERPDPSYANVIEVVGDADTRIHSLSASATLMMLNWRRTFLMANYSISSTETNTGGPFALPARGDDLAGEWGPAAPRHRFGAAFNMKPFGALGVAVNVRAQSGTPYDVTLGTDANGDGVFNDRPAGLGRNSALTDAQWDVGLRLTYAIGFGQRSSPGGGGTVVMIGGGGSGGGMPGGFGGGGGESRFRIEFYASAQNVTNHNNYVGYSGVITSPFFGLPTNVLNPRKIELGMRFGF